MTALFARVAAAPTATPSPRKERSKTSHLRGWEHRKEADEAVEVNLAPDELAAWRRLRSRFKGTPHQRLEAFRQWQHDHPKETRVHLLGEVETKTRKAIRSYEAQPMAKVACKPPYRGRVYAQCSGKLIGSRGKAPSGRAVEVPCREPYRFRSKDLCDPKPTYWKPPKEDEEMPHAFEGILG